MKNFLLFAVIYFLIYFTFKKLFLTILYVNIYNYFVVGAFIKLLLKIKLFRKGDHLIEQVKIEKIAETFKDEEFAKRIIKIKGNMLFFLLFAVF